MDNAWLWLYLFTRLDALHGVAAVVATIGGVLAVLGVVGLYVQDDIGDFFRSHLRKSTIAATVSGLFLVAVPTQSDMALIVGGHFVAQGITSEPVVETAQDLYRLVRAELDARLAEIETPEESD